MSSPLKSLPYLFSISFVAATLGQEGRPVAMVGLPHATVRTVSDIQPVQAQEGDDQEPPMLYRGPGQMYIVPGTNGQPDQYVRPFPDYSTLRRWSGTRLRDQRNGFGGYGAYNGFDNNCGPNGSAPYAWGGGGYYGDVEDAYNQGRYDADYTYLEFLASQRAGRLLNQYREMFDEGLKLFHEGRYDLALVKWIGAGEANHQNGACRLHAGHAMFALGRYAESVSFLSRAFELAPSLPYKTYDIRDEYGNKAEFEQQLAALKARVAANPNDAAMVTLLGYVTFYSTGPGAAYPMLARAARLDPNSYFVPKLLGLSASTQSQRIPKQQPPTQFQQRMRLSPGPTRQPRQAVKEPGPMVVSAQGVSR